MIQGSYLNNVSKDNRWHIVGILWCIVFLTQGFPYYGAAVINPFMGDALAMSRSELGFAFTLFVLFVGLPGPVIARVVNRYGARFTLCLGIMAILIGSLMMVFVVQSSISAILVFGVVVGSGVAFGGMVASQAVVVTWFTTRRAFALGIVLTGQGVGGFLAAPLLGEVIGYSVMGWRAAWLVVAGAALIAFILAVIVKNKPQVLSDVELGAEHVEACVDGGAEAKLNHNKQYFLKERSFWIVVFAGAAYQYCMTSVLAHGTPHILDIGHEAATAAFFISAITFSSIFGKIGASVLAEKVAIPNLWSIALAIFSIGVFMLMLSETIYLLLFSAVLIGLALATSIVCMMALLACYYPPKTYVLAIGAVLPIITISGALGPWIAGWMYDQFGTYFVSFGCAAVLAMIGAIAIRFATSNVGKTPLLRSM